MFDHVLSVLSLLPYRAKLMADIPSLPALRHVGAVRDDVRDVYILELEWWDVHDRRWIPAMITLRGLSDPLIDLSRTDAWLFGIEPPVDLFFKVADVLASLPALVLLLPFVPSLVTIDRLLRVVERRHGLSRHAYALVTDLGFEIDAQAERLVTHALKNFWRGRATRSCPHAA